MILWRRILDELREDGACCLVTVAASAGSAPRETGARMFVRADGSISGTIGGGTLEFEAIRWAVSGMREGRRGLALRRVSLGPDLGQCCGGRVDLALEHFTAEDIEPVRALVHAQEERGGQLAVRAAFSQEGVPLQRHVMGSFAPGRISCWKMASSRSASVWSFSRSGCSGPGMWAVQWCWRSRRFLSKSPGSTAVRSFPPAMPGNLRYVSASRPAELLKDAPDNAFILVMTHSHSLDEDIVAAALALDCFPYVGVIGSETKRARFTNRLRRRGLTVRQVGGLVCPIGAAGVKSKLPAAIAASVAVELLIKNEAVKLEGLYNQPLAQGRKPVNNAG
ncbi:XdhC family protein [Pannonibacter phragmitetus]|uniref:XdhC family protein n=1 Tax=Pannonibacter phragmitetus TaxID=121719 RepID=UPI003D2F2974